MPDFAEVSDTIAGICAGLLYPSGSGQPSATGDIITIFPGWPQPKCLTDTLKAGKVQVSIYPLTIEKNTTRYDESLREVSRVDKTIGIALGDDGKSFTLSGSFGVGQVVSVICNGVSASQATQAGDTAIALAARLATSLVTAGLQATSSGAVVTVSDAYRLSVKVGAGGQLWRELKRQEKQFMVTVWAPTHAKRSAIGKILDTGLARLHYLQFPDYMAGRNRYVRGTDTDQAEEIMLYRRDLVYSIDYPTIEFVDGFEVTAVLVSSDASNRPEEDWPLQQVIGA